MMSDVSAAADDDDDAVSSKQQEESTTIESTVLDVLSDEAVSSADADILTAITNQLLADETPSSSSSYVDMSDDLRRSNDALRQILSKLERHSRNPTHSQLSIQILMEEQKQFSSCYDIQSSTDGDMYDEMLLPHSFVTSTRLPDIGETQRLLKESAPPSHPYEKRVKPVYMKQVPITIPSITSTDNTAIATAATSVASGSKPKKQANFAEKEATRRAKLQLYNKERRKEEMLSRADKLMEEIEKESGMEVNSIYNTKVKNIFVPKKKLERGDVEEDIFRENRAKDCIRRMRLLCNVYSDAAITLTRAMGSTEKQLLVSPYAVPIAKRILTNLGFNAEHLSPLSESYTTTSSSNSINISCIGHSNATDGMKKKTRK